MLSKENVLCAAWHRGHIVIMEKKNPLSRQTKEDFLAEKEGFEPSIPFWGIHDFQSCALGQLRDFSMRCRLTADSDIIHEAQRNVKHYFSFFGHFLFQNLACSQRITNVLQFKRIYARKPT